MVIISFQYAFKYSFLNILTYFAIMLSDLPKHNWIFNEIIWNFYQYLVHKPVRLNKTYMLNCDGKYYSRQGQENKIAFTVLKCPSFQFYSLAFQLALGELFIFYSAVSKISMCQLLSHKYIKAHFLVRIVPETYCVVEQHTVFSLLWHGKKCLK